MVRAASLALAIVLVSLPLVAEASLVGDQFTVSGNIGGSSFGNNIPVNPPNPQLVMSANGSAVITVSGPSTISLTVSSLGQSQFVFDGLDWGGNPPGIVTAVATANDTMSGGATVANVTGPNQITVTTQGFGSVNLNVTASHVPEPSSLALLSVVGIAFAGWRIRRRRVA